jgi:site-specific DNA recombinase
MSVAIYLRVSTEEQRERQSIATQREFGERYTQLHGLAVYRVYADDGVSGTVPLEQRPEGKQILRDSKHGRFDQLLVYKLDRLGRETRLILNAVADLEKRGVRVRSMTEEFDTGTATGRLMLTMLSGFASHEREVIRERSAAGITRLAEAGVWLGGVVPYGYRKAGEGHERRLVISEEPIPGLDMSEADVIQEIFRLATVEKQSCRAIAARLNGLRIPCAYVRDSGLGVPSRRKKTQGIWRAGRVLGLLNNKTYKGTHEFGKRSKKREVVSRPAPAIVSEETWQKAQQTIKSNLLFSKRSAKNKYLLRGLVKCGSCGFTYVGIAANRPNGKLEFYYRCNGAHSPQIYRPHGRCQSKAVRGDLLEQQVWSDIETFLRNPGSVLEQLNARLEGDAKGSEQIAKQITRLESLLEQKATERNRLLGLYRRGRLSDAELDSQTDEIAKEQAALEAQAAELRARVQSQDSIVATITSAQDLLTQLQQRLDEPISWEVKRRLVEALVSDIRIDTYEECGVKQAKTTVTYRFSRPEQAMPLVLSQSYTSGARVIRIPAEPKTIGDHIRRRRLALKLLQKDVAKRIGVNVKCLNAWEANTSTPEVRFMAKVIEFLGYNPLPPANGLAEELVRQRTTLGLTQRDAAARMGVDPTTLARWERGEKEPWGRFVERVNRFLGLHVALSRKGAA